MRRTLFLQLLTLTAIIFLVACSPESSTEPTYTDAPEATNDDETITPTPVRVFVNNQTLFTTAGATSSRQGDLTRGVGSFQIGKDEDLVTKLSQLSDEERALISQKYNRTNFYIYAFRAKTMTKPNLDAPDFRHYNLVNVEDPNGHAPAASLADTKDQWHCLVDGQDYHKGLLGNLEMSATRDADMFKLKTPFDDRTGERKVIYYPDRVDVGYNFFAYSVGDISTDDFSTDDKSVDWGQCERLEDQVVYRNFTVDGSQDVMAGYAPPIKYVLSSVPNLTDTEREQIQQFGYSTFAAQRGIAPMINLRHLLTRIKFQALPGDESASKTTIDAIYVRCHNKGDFVVAHRDTTQVGFYPYENQVSDVYVHDKPVILQDGNGKQYLQPSQIHDTSVYTPENGNVDELTDDMLWRVEWKDEYYVRDDDGYPIYRKPLNQRGEPVHLGDNLMVPPSENLDIYIKFTYKLGEYNERKFINHYTINAADLVESNPKREKYYLDDDYFKKTGEKRYIFKPGYFYVITHAVYGISQSRAYAYVDAWKEGDTEIMMDERPGGDTK